MNLKFLHEVENNSKFKIINPPIHLNILFRYFLIQFDTGWISLSFTCLHHKYCNSSTLSCISTNCTKYKYYKFIIIWTWMKTNLKVPNRRHSRSTGSFIQFNSCCSSGVNIFLSSTITIFIEITYPKHTYCHWGFSL